MNKVKLLWIDDEVEMLKPHFFFLKREILKFPQHQMEMME